MPSALPDVSPVTSTQVRFFPLLRFNLMNTRSSFRLLGLCAIALIAATAYPTSAPARGYAGGGFHGGAFRGGGGIGYGWRGGYGNRGGWRGYGYRGWGWGGLGYGLFFGALPLYYSTLWWGGVPYYYAAGDYYQWNGTVGEYETVAPPPGMNSQASGQQPAVASLFVYPKNGQSAGQQATDRYECHRWAKDQTGFDPTQPGGVAATDAPKAGVTPASPAAAAVPASRQDYIRAQTACLEGRGYSVR
jgi:hypothetical protein